MRDSSKSPKRVNCPQSILSGAQGVPSETTDLPGTGCGILWNFS
jgi:hypothetical protein